MRFDKFSQIPLYPLFLSIFPTLSLLGINIAETAPGEALRAVLLSIFLTGCVYILAYAVLRDWPRAALAASILIIFFFSYGHIYNLVKQITLGNIPIGRHRYLSLIWVGLVAAGWWWAKTVAAPKTFIRSLNLLAAALLIYPAIQVAPAIFQTLRTAAGSSNDLQSAISEANAADQPDIYYIIPDAYTRDDTLLDLYEFDNTPFLSALEDRGFYVARCSRSNFPRTYLSLSSSLNMDYVQELSPLNDSNLLTKLIKHSLVREKLEALGYTIVAFDAGYFRTQWSDADHYLSYDAAVGGSARLAGVNEFETILVETTAVRFLLDGNLALGGELLEFVYESGRQTRYNRIEFILDNIIPVSKIPGPKFVFIHIPAPHEPYIFSPTGEFIPDRDEYIPGYGDQVSYINSRLLEAVDEILATSDIPPIIILQGDHGGIETQGDFRRLHILNAYYLPAGAQDLYPAITPVNTFRVIFDNYFGENLGLLPDISYHSTPDSNFSFTVAPMDRAGCE